MLKHTKMHPRLSHKNLKRHFSQLDPKDLKTLYAYSKIKELQAGECLLKEGENGQEVYVILEGELKISRTITGAPTEIARLGTGDWVGEIAFAKKIPRTASATAISPTRVMSINTATFNALNARTQLFFLKKLNDLANGRIHQLVSSEKELQRKNRQLIDRIYAERFQGKRHYRDAGIIRGIIKKVPRLPSFASTLLVRMAQPNTSLREITDLIKQDPSTVAVVLKTVNSPYYGLRQKISDVNHALMLIGFSRVYQLIVADGLKRVMPNSSSFAAIQSHSVAISHIAFGLSMASRTGNPSEAMTVGLLHDLGRVLVLLLKKQNPSLGILIDSLEHARLSALLLEEWGMPDKLMRILEFQSYPELLPPESVPRDIRHDVAILYLAHLCLSVFTEKSDGPPQDIFAMAYMRLFGWQNLDIDQLIRKNLMPIFSKGIDAYPIAFRHLLNGYTVGS